MEVDAENLKRQRGRADKEQKLHESDSSGDFHHHKKRGDESMITYTGSVEQAPMVLPQRGQPMTNAPWLRQNQPQATFAPHVAPTHAPQMSNFSPTQNTFSPHTSHVDSRS
eukprot:11585689-Karenia_brevis.AAC.1